MTKIKAIVSDANILIDYAKTNPTILMLASSNLFDIYIPEEVFNESKDLSRSSAKTLGLNIIEPTLDQVVEAAEKAGKLSYEDNLCFALARDNGWACATNDKGLRGACSKNKIICIWGFEIMLELVKRSFLSLKVAIKTAKDIEAINSRITKSVVADFIKKIERI